jgi:hypothetical protein
VFRAAAFAVSCAATLAVAAGTATPAHAVPGLQQVTATSAADSNVFKGIRVGCPAGKLVVGGGAAVGGGGAEVAVTHFAPLPAGDGFGAKAYEDKDGFAGNWTLTVYAFCADPVAGYEIKQATSPAASPSEAGTGVICTAGKQLLGTGAEVSPGRGDVILTGAVPVVGGVHGVRAIGQETEGGFAGTWTVSGWAICANPVPGHAAVTASSGVDSASPKAALVKCPAGTAVHGTGLHISGGAGEVQLAEIVVGPSPVGTVARALAYEDQTGYPGNWQVRSHAICAS